MRLLNQMLNLSRIFDCNSVADSAKSYLILKLLIQTSNLKAVTSRIKLDTCEIRCLNRVMATMSSITINTGRYATIHMAFFIFL